LTGKFVLAGLVASATLGLDTNKNTAYQVFMFLLALLLAALACNYFFRATLSVRRDLPRFGTVGQLLPYRVTVLNHSAGTLQGFVFLEDLSDPRPSFDDFRKSIHAGMAGVSRWIRDPWHRYWTRLYTMNRIAESDKRALPPLLSRGETEFRTGLMPARRGRLRFESISIGRPDPFGLTHAFVTVPQKQSILILPRRYALPDLDLPGTRAYQHGGISLSTSVADSEEFQSLREYRPGDPLRLIHWKSWARVGKPVVREYQDEFFVRHALVLDTYMKAGQPDIFEEAVSVAASFACTVQTRESLLDLLFVGAEAYCETIGRGQGQTDHLLEILACVRPCTDKPFSVLHHLVASRRSSMSGCICVLLSWDDDRRNFIDHLNRLGVQTLVIVITDPGLKNIPSLASAHERPAWLHVLETGRIEEGLAML